MKSLATNIPRVFLKQGEVVFADQPVLVSTVLGSCVAITMHDRRKMLAAICHALLPRLPKGTTSAADTAERFRYVDGAISEMLRLFSDYSVESHGLEIKLFGGAERLCGGKGHRPGLSVGAQNIEMAHHVIETTRLNLVASDVGGTQGRKIIFNTQSGEILLKRVRNLKTT